MAYIKDYYQILGVRPNCTLKEIRRAYRQLAILHHPDRNPDRQSTGHMQELNEAYSVLGDPRKRLQYDFGHLDSTVKIPTNHSAFRANTISGIKLQPFFIQSKSIFLVLLIIVIFLMFSTNFLTWDLATQYVGPENSAVLFLCLDTLIMKRILTLWQLFTASESEFKCPKCRNLWAAEILREKLLGIFKKYVQVDRHGKKVHGVWYEKYKIQCKCKYCGHEWIFTKSIKQ
jgi:hypothetical protein